MSIHVDSAATREEALKTLKKKHKDCIVSDLPIAGNRWHRTGEEIGEASNIPIILFTGRGGEEVAEEEPRRMVVLFSNPCMLTGFFYEKFFDSAALMLNS
jgi:aspartate/glutamate racemase